MSHVSANDNNDLSYRAKGKKDIFTILKILSAIFQSLKLDNSKHFIMKITAAIRATFLQTTTMISAKEPRKKTCRNGHKEMNSREREKKQKKIEHLSAFLLLQFSRDVLTIIAQLKNLWKSIDKKFLAVSFRPKQFNKSLEVITWL